MCFNKTTIPKTMTSETTTNDHPSVGLDQVNVSFLNNTKSNNKKLPLVITPRWNNTSLKFLTSFCQMNRSWLDTQVNTYGAILFRGFELYNALDMEQAMLSYQPNLCNEYRGT